MEELITKLYDKIYQNKAVSYRQKVIAILLLNLPLILIPLVFLMFILS